MGCRLSSDTLGDGSTWETLQWIDLHSRYALGQVTAATLTEELVVRSFLQVANHSYYFSRSHAGQAVTVTVDGWTATAQAADGAQQTWDLHPATLGQPSAPRLAVIPQPLTRKVDRRGCLHISHRLYYVGTAWATRTLTLQPQGTSWAVEFPDGSTKVLPNPQLLPAPGQKRFPPRSQTPPSDQPGTLFHTRRVTKTGQVAFHNRLYYARVSLYGQTVKVIPLTEGLAVYNADNAWITTCPWRPDVKPVEPLCPP